MRENKNIIAGKMARKNLNAMDDALIVIDSVSDCFDKEVSHII